MGLREDTATGPKQRTSPRELAVAPEFGEVSREKALSDIGGYIRKRTADESRDHPSPERRLAG